MLWRVVKDQDAWMSFGRKFFERHWPLERSFQTQQTTRQLLTLLAESEEHFDQVLEKILPLLTPLEGESMFIHRMTKFAQDESLQISKKPNGTLTVLDRIFPDSTVSVPHNLQEALNLIAKTSPELRLNRAWQRLNKLWWSNFG